MRTLSQQEMDQVAGGWFSLSWFSWSYKSYSYCQPKTTYTCEPKPVCEPKPPCGPVELPTE
jgi:hypothetical protein